MGCYGTLMLPAVPLPFQLPPLVSFGYLFVFGDSTVVLGLVLHGQPLIYNSFESTTSWLGLSPTVASGMISLYSQPSTCSNFSGIFIVGHPSDQSGVAFSHVFSWLAYNRLKSGFGFDFNIVVSLVIPPLFGLFFMPAVVCSILGTPV